MRKRSHSKLWIRFTVGVIFITFTVFSLMAAIALISFYYGYFPQHRNPIVPIISMVFFCMIISTFFTLIIGHRILRPIETLIDATKKVAKGDFSVRLDENYPEDEIRDMNLHFNKMIDELNGIETLRNDFIVNVSHEFKTPIASIEGYATLLQDPLLIEEERKEYTQMILDSAAQLSSLSGNILKLSEFESQKIMPEKKSFSLDEQIRQALLFLEGKWSKKNLEIDLELPIINYFGNEEFLMQVWLNIYGNAIKFTPESGKIYTSIKEYDNRIYVSISDTGSGMTEEVQKHIFEKFYQGDRTRHSEGNGLGLTLVKRILDLLGGSIEVQSEIGIGTTFTVCLPLES
ncbi:HAMP domain-containing sensor histidine kinase [Clostridium omnivorum]|uniref:Heme sensor protein HssS n=1 Tax=Clostridium omnivorum TaxID=1604902 RepID=A0ABQ5N7N3_9CLOT|nr:HAMP domain-containing sensor histidine kinase [Clostridium sp. E14]GLC31242.1 two component sensor kinase [Clostridium sp. E14]